MDKKIDLFSQVDFLVGAGGYPAFSVLPTAPSGCDKTLVLATSQFKTAVAQF